VSWLRLWYRPKPVEGERLFQPPAEVSARTDSIDESLARDAEHMTPTRKIALGTFSVLSIGSNFAGGTSGAFPQHGSTNEIIKIWGTDTFTKGDKK
jgi:hypothetical protein